ncbi:hypothetical protein JCM3770_003855 [Rhodotorula araucariae]
MAPQPVPGSYSVRHAATNHRDDPNVLVVARGFGDGDAARWPEQGQDMALLGPDNDKEQQWRRTAAEIIAKDLGLVDEAHQHWILDELPTGYGLFQQVTHPKETPAGPQGGGGNKSKLRLDRFIFGHNSKKIRSALSLGKHISNQLFGARSLCHCDGCRVSQPKATASSMADIGAPLRMAPRKRKRTGEYADLAGLAPRANSSGEPDSAGAGGAAAPQFDDDAASAGTQTEREGSVATAGGSAPATGAGASAGAAGGSTDKPGARAQKKVRKSAAGARKRFAAAAAEEEEHYGVALAADDGSDYEEPAYRPVDFSRVGARTSSGRRTRPSERLLSGLQQEAEAQAVAAAAKPPVPVDEYDEVMASAGKDVLVPSSTVPDEQAAEDLANPTLARVGELVWVRVPLGPPPSGAPETAQLSRWPGLIRSRVVTTGENGVKEEVYRVELLGMSPLDVLEGVRGENVTPWAGYVPSNTEWLDTHALEDDGLRAGDEKKRWGEIQAEGWMGVANAFRKAHRIGKAYAAIQIRPIPTIRKGSHLAAKPDTPPVSISALESKDAGTRFLAFSHLIFGPELLHVGDYVRLSPTAEVDPAILAERTARKPDALPTTLVMRVGTLYRGGRGSPLVARGLVFELKPVAPNDATLDISLMSLPQAILQALPPPLPLHKWRLLAPPGAESSETEIIFAPAVAGRYYPLTLPAGSSNETVEAVNARLDEATDGQGVWQDGQGATGGKGEEGIKALALLLGGMAAGNKTARIDATNGLAGNRIDQLVVAEEQALGRPIVPADLPATANTSALGTEAPRRPGEENVDNVNTSAQAPAAPTSEVERVGADAPAGTWAQ